MKKDALERDFSWLSKFVCPVGFRNSWLKSGLGTLISAQRKNCFFFSWTGLLKIPTLASVDDYFQKATSSWRSGVQSLEFLEKLNLIKNYQKYFFEQLWLGNSLFIIFHHWKSSYEGKISHNFWKMLAIKKNEFI